MDSTTSRPYLSAEINTLVATSLSRYLCCSHQCTGRRLAHTLQSRRHGISKLPCDLAVNQFQICLYLDQKGNVQTNSSQAVTGAERDEILKEAIPKFSRLLRHREPSFSQETTSADPFDISVKGTRLILVQCPKHPRQYATL